MATWLLQLAVMMPTSIQAGSSLACLTSARSLIICTGHTLHCCPLLTPTGVKHCTAFEPPLLTSCSKYEAYCSLNLS